VSTVSGLVDRVHQAVTAEGMDLSPHDVGHVVALFFEGLVHDPAYGHVNHTLQRIADECESVTDE
jgi:hypothetical protein